MEKGEREMTPIKMLSEMLDAQKGCLAGCRIYKGIGHKYMACFDLEDNRCICHAGETLESVISGVYREWESVTGAGEHD